MTEKRFIIDSFLENDELFRPLLEEIEQGNPILAAETGLEAVSDDMGGTIWGGELPGRKSYCSLVHLQKKREHLNNLGIGLYLEATNRYLEEKHLNDYYCCKVVEELAQNGLNGVIVTSPLLYSRLKKEAPQLKLLFQAESASLPEELDSQTELIIFPEMASPFEGYEKVTRLSESCRWNCIHREECGRARSKTRVSYNYQHADYFLKQNCPQLAKKDSFNLNRKVELEPGRYYLQPARRESYSFIQAITSYMINPEVREQFYRNCIRTL